ncbi:hypothetical protein [Brevibacillus centrosporus]|uniref:hypothetical protein n=1 Tax=Brevibacillus centrosporus TaxID=54910 RepID=UPI002E1B8D85|nr:hypothetical protein [Brevibacillus centrosporus]
MLESYTIRGVVADALTAQKIKRKQFATEIDMDPSFLSRVLNGEKMMPLPSLDKSIALLGLNPAECYTLYFTECWESKKKNPAIIEKYILHCIKNGYAEHAEHALNTLLEMGGYLNCVYAIGNALFQEDKKTESRKFFDAVINHEDDKKSSVLALSYYRKLMTYYHSDLDKSIETAISLWEHIDFIPEDEILEAHYRVIGAYRLKYKWESVLQYGDKLVRLARSMRKDDYMGDAFIKMALAARELGNFPLALEYHDECMKIQIGNYRIWGMGNKLITLITAGEIDKIQDLFDFCQSYKELSFEYLEFLLDASVKNELYGIVERIFRDFHDEIAYLESHKDERSIYARHLINFSYAKAIYFLKMGNNTGIDEALRVAELAINLRLHRQALQSVKLVFTYAEKTSTAYQRCLSLIDAIA